tara:strand:+ start:141 stop:632 length:492 start_codon:yes stop_codon:yes gene_type:complete
MSKRAINLLRKAMVPVFAFAGTVFARGYDTTTPSLLVKYPAPAAAIGTGASTTITVAQILTGILEEDPAGAVTWTLPTAALLVAGVTDVAIGDTLDFAVINTDATADIAITIAAGTDGSLVGNDEVESADKTADAISSGSAMFRIRFTGVASGSEAYVAYRMA